MTAITTTTVGTIAIAAIDDTDSTVAIGTIENIDTLDTIDAIIGTTENIFGKAMPIKTNKTPSRGKPERCFFIDAKWFKSYD